MTDQTTNYLPIDKALMATIIDNLTPEIITGKLIVQARVTYWAMVDDGSIDPTETEIRIEPKDFSDRYWSDLSIRLEDLRKHAHWLNDEVKP